MPKTFGKRGRRLVLAVAPVALLAACAVDLGSLGGDYAAAEGVNDTGVTVGFAYTPDGVAHAFRREPGGTMVDINGDAGSSRAHAVNNAGVAVGEADSSAVLWQPDGTMVDLGLGPSSSANDINDAGTIVGGRGADAVVLAASGEVTVLPPAFPDIQGWQVATGINGQGDVVGSAAPPSGALQAVLWEAPNYTPVVLSDRPNHEVRVADVNDDGTVVGTAWYRYTSVALLWRAGTHEEVELAGGPDDAFTRADGINDDGTVVGTAVEVTTTFVDRAVRWGPGVVSEPVRLGSLGGGSSRALDVNDQGDVVGSAAVRTSDGDVIEHAVLFPHDG